MSFVRTRIVVAFEADLDAVAGPWDNNQDWINLITREFKLLEAAGSYRVTHQVLSVQDMKKPFNETVGKYENPQFDDVTALLQRQLAEVTAERDALKASVSA